MEFILGLVAGLFISSFVWFTKVTVGTLKIDHSNPDKDVFKFEIDDLTSLTKKKFVFIKIVNTGYDSHE